MSDPVVLIGVDETGRLVAVGLYATIEDAGAAVNGVAGGTLPKGFYSVMTPPLGQTYVMREAAAGKIAMVPRS